ncbi:hypothetical protein HDU83_001079 [Entophlyctis luteolus]|nr:hypothetical protein HDU83_001079 [Entophlyctis luteolus]
MLSLDTKPSFHDLSPLLANPLSAAVAQQQPGPPAASSSSSTEQSAASAFAASTSSSSVSVLPLSSLPSSDPNPYDEITTIFVVGFPEDIQEREFQNMFTFASGFEAATLKFPANFDADDGIPAYKKQIVSGATYFHTPDEANYARDYLTGRKVDSERGSVLKAEIAKKNLHIKRPSNLNTNNVGMIDFIGSANPLSATPYGIGSVLQYNAPIQSPGLNSGVPQNQQPLRHPSNSMSAFTNRSFYQFAFAVGYSQ